MRPRLLFHILSLLIGLQGIAMLLPLLTALIYQEGDVGAFLISSLFCIGTGFILFFFTRGPRHEISHKEGFAIVALAWIVISLFGAIPFLLTGALGNFTDACFESVSGFTTTGSSVVTEIENLSHAILIWRSFSQWLGGMGIILLSIAILPLLGVGGMQLYKAEVPGPVMDKLRPRIGDTAKLLWKVYLFFTFLEFILLRAGGMTFFDAICHSFTTMAIGGFSTKNASIEAFNSAYIEGVITFFMFIAGVNFALHFQLLRGNVKALLRDDEFVFYVIILFASVICLSTALMFFNGYDLLSAIRYGSFQGVSIMTTTGYSSTDFGAWSYFGQYFLLMLMFIGACAGSTGGSIKVLRIHLLLKQGYRELYRLIHPRAVVHIKFNGSRVSPEVMEAIWGFFFLYIFLFVIAGLVMSLLGLDAVTALSSVAASIGNVGPGLAGVGPYENYSHLPLVGKWVLIACMILGRLEIYTLIVLLMPEYWKK